MTEENIRYCMDLLKRTYSEPEKVADETLDRLSSLNMNCARSIYAYMCFAGTIPEVALIFLGYSEEEKENHLRISFLRFFLFPIIQTGRYSHIQQRDLLFSFIPWYQGLFMMLLFILLMQEE